MTMHSHTHAHTSAENVPAVIVVLESVSKLAELVHRERQAVAKLHLKLGQWLSVHEAHALIGADAKDAECCKSQTCLPLETDADYRRLRARRDAICHHIAVREATVERGLTRISSRCTCCPSPFAPDARPATARGNNQERLTHWCHAMRTGSTYTCSEPQPSNPDLKAVQPQQFVQFAAKPRRATHSESNAVDLETA